MESTPDCPNEMWVRVCYYLCHWCNERRRNAEAEVAHLRTEIRHLNAKLNQAKRVAGRPTPEPLMLPFTSAATDPFYTPLVGDGGFLTTNSRGGALCALCRRFGGHTNACPMRELDWSV